MKVAQLEKSSRFYWTNFWSPSKGISQLIKTKQYDASFSGVKWEDDKKLERGGRRGKGGSEEGGDKEGEREEGKRREGERRRRAGKAMRERGREGGGEQARKGKSSQA